MTIISNLWEAVLSDLVNSPKQADLSLAAFAEALASNSAAPGGGAATALAGALAAALAAMVARLTLDRPRYAGVAAEMARVCEQADALRTQLLGLVDADSQAYAALMAAYALPKGTAAQDAGRASAIQAALRAATAVPLATAEACMTALTLAAHAAEQGNRNAAGDAAVAALLAHAGLIGAARNVRLNLRGIVDAAYREETAARAADLAAAGDNALAAALRAADARA